MRLSILKNLPTLNLLCLCLVFGFQTPALAQNGKITVLIATELGEIEAVLDSAAAPITTAHFLKYAAEGQYDGGTFYRTVTMQNQPDNDVKIEVVQAGINPSLADREHAMIPLERTRDTGMKHIDGAVSIGRTGVNTATYRFFICIGDQPELDYGGKRNPDGQGFAAFGRVVRGMDIVRKIQSSPHEDQNLTPPIKIIRISRQ